MLIMVTQTKPSPAALARDTGVDGRYHLIAGCVDARDRAVALIEHPDIGVGAGHEPRRGANWSLGGNVQFYPAALSARRGYPGHGLRVSERAAIIYRVFAKWADDGSLDQAFIASVRHLAKQHHLDLNILHGDGTNTL
jgi:hypothetical protein